MKLLFASLTILLSTLAVVPAGGQVLYSNGLCQLSSGGCNTTAWTLNFGFIDSDNFTLNSNAKMTGFDFVVWLFPGDQLINLDYSVTSAENGGTVYGSGRQVMPVLVNDQGINQMQYDIRTYEISTSGISLNAGTYWLNLSNAVVNTGDPVYWDENSGAGCSSPGCPSSASQNATGTIPSESFDILGTSSTGTGMTPEPSSILLFGSGVLGLSTVLRRKLF